MQTTGEFGMRIGGGFVARTPGGFAANTQHSLRYFGKTTKKLARQRITNHLFRKNEKTGSKLAQVIVHACEGGAVENA